MASNPNGSSPSRANEGDPLGALEPSDDGKTVLTSRLARIYPDGGERSTARGGNSPGSAPPDTAPLDSMISPPTDDPSHRRTRRRYPTGGLLEDCNPSLDRGPSRGFGQVARRGHKAVRKTCFSARIGGRNDLGKATFGAAAATEACAPQDSRDAASSEPSEARVQLITDRVADQISRKNHQQDRESWKG